MKSLALLLAIALSASAALLSTCRSTSAAEAHHRHYHHHHHISGTGVAPVKAFPPTRGDAGGRGGSIPPTGVHHHHREAISLIPLPRVRSAYFSLEEALVRRAIWELREAELRSLYPKEERQ